MKNKSLSTKVTLSSLAGSGLLVTWKVRPAAGTVVVVAKLCPALVWRSG